MEHVDFLAADAHKWLLGPCGAGIFYVRRELQEKLNPPIYGWHNVKNPNFVAQEQIVFRGGAVKYEAGTHNLIGLVGLVAAMELALEIGIENIAAELLRKRALAGARVAGERLHRAERRCETRKRRRHRFIFPARKGFGGAAQKAGGSRNCHLAARRPEGQNYIRLSPHFYNTDAELQRALELL